MKQSIRRFFRRLFDAHDPHLYAAPSVWQRQQARVESAKPVYATWEEYQRELRERRDRIYQRETAGNVRQIRKAAVQ